MLGRMAKVVPVSGFFLSGAVGPLVFCRRGNGVYARARVKPRDPKTVAQRDKRNRFGAAVAAWRALSDADRASVRRRAEFVGRTGYNLFIAEFMQKSAAPA
jgi:hypothetical protein